MGNHSAHSERRGTTAPREDVTSEAPAMEEGDGGWRSNGSFDPHRLRRGRAGQTVYFFSFGLCDPFPSPLSGGVGWKAIREPRYDSFSWGRW